MDKFFLVQIKQTNGTISKGVVVKDSFDDAKQGFHAYMGAYAYGHEEGTDYVQCGILGPEGLHMVGEVWDNTPKPEPEEVEE